MNSKDQEKAWHKYKETKKRIASGSAAPVAEPADKQRARIAELLGDFEKFCKYYFLHYMAADFGYFHKRDIKAIRERKNIFAVLEWPRAHAKSVIVDVFLTLYLKARGELDGVILVSNNKEKAMMLLADCQAEFEGNERYINDFGKQATYGNWEEQNFVTQDGIGFWAFGRGQSPRGTREGAKRPNLIIVDDIDDNEICENEDRVEKAVNWIKGDLLGCFSLKGGRFVMVGNRIHQKSILAHIVGDVEEGQKPKEHIYHSKVYALENPKTHKEDQSEKGVPAWKEYYTREEVDARMLDMGYRAAQREFFHKHIVEGKIFKKEWIKYGKRLPLGNYQHIVTYLDPSYKDTKKNDFKALIAVARTGIHYHIIKCWVRQATKKAMVAAHYDMDEQLKANGSKAMFHYMEANFMQEDIHFPEYIKEAETRGSMLPVTGDKRDKPNKLARIENMTPLFERGLITFDEALQNDKDTGVLVGQLLAFPTGHDDGPDALEGAIFMSNSKTISTIPTLSGARRRTERL